MVSALSRHECYKGDFSAEIRGAQSERQFSHLSYIISFSVTHIIYFCILNESDSDYFFWALNRKILKTSGHLVYKCF